MDAETRADLERLVAEGLNGLREHPAPLLAERFACMVGAPPSLASATATETATWPELAVITDTESRWMREQA